MLPKSASTFFKISSLLLFLLFVLEILVLHPRNLSVRGVATEKMFWWLMLLCGFLGFGIKKFGLSLLLFLVLTMIPMMIPFINLLTWSFQTNKNFEVEQGERLEEVKPFGQYQSVLFLVRPKGFFLEEYYQSSTMTCTIQNLDDVQLEKIRQQQDGKHTQFTLFYTTDAGSQVCVLALE